MAVTTNYSLNFIQDLDLTQGPTSSQADATSLANGGFAVSGTHAGHTDFDVFNANLSDGGGGNVFTGTNSAIDQLSNGNLVMVGQDADSVVFNIVTSAGATVNTLDIGDTGSTNADVAALTGGGFVIVSQDFFGGTDFDIDVSVRNNAGAVITTFSIDASGAMDTAPAVCALLDGGFAVAWQRTIAGETEVWRAVYNANGTVRTAAAVFDSFGTINRNVDIVAKADGGFAVVYEDNGWGNGGTDITLAEFNSAGTFQTFSNVSNPTGGSSTNDANATVTRLANGLLVVGFDDNSFSDTDGIAALFDAGSNTVLATRNISGDGSIFDDITAVTIAGSALGGINVFQTNLTDSDVDGEALVGQRTSTSDAAGDFILGDDFIDIMNGNAGADTLIGAANNDTLNGGDDNDTLNGGAGVDTQLGGGGSDTFIINTNDLFAPGETINGGAQFDRVLVQSSEVLRKATFTSIEEIEFSGGGTISAKISAAQLGAGLSNALLVDGRVGLSDQIQISMLADTAVNLTNWIFQDWISTGPDNDRIKIIGDASAENIIGSSQRDDINAGGGSDIINGGLGSDFLRGGAADDRFVFNTALGPSNVDRILDFTVNVDEIRLENTIFTGLANGNLNANAFRIGASAADASDRIIYNSNTGALSFDVDGQGGVAAVRFATLAKGLALDNLDFIVT